MMVGMRYIDRVDNYMAGLFGPDVYRVGGGVRDEILGRKPKDGDYVVTGRDLPTLMRDLSKAGARPTLIKDRAGHKLGYRINPKGLGLIEIVLPRAERKADTGAGNERHNFEIVVDPNLPLAEDAVRRDFTFNAIYKRVATGEIVDPLDGVGSLNAGDIETTHERSFADDPLRILRAIRFVSVLGFEPTSNTWSQMMDHSPAMAGGLTDKGVSGTVLDEINKTLMGDNVAAALRLARDTGALTQIFPELAPIIGFEQESAYHDMTVDEHTFLALDAAARMDATLRVRWALLFHDSGKPESAWRGEDGRLHYYKPKDCDDFVDHADVGSAKAQIALARLNADRKLRRDVPKLIEKHMLPLQGKVKPTKIRLMRVEFGDDLLADLFKHRLADCMGKGSVTLDDINSLAHMEAIRQEAEDQGIPASAKDLKDAGLIDGRDLLAMGLEGEQISKVLAQLLHEVVSQPKLGEREWLLTRAEKLAGKVR